MGRKLSMGSPVEMYKSMVDYTFLESMGVVIKQAPKCPWQFFVTHPDLTGKFVYYPSTGSVVYEALSGRMISYKIKAYDGEELYALIISEINKH